MDISITSEHEDFVSAVVEDGRYASVDAVVDAGLNLLEERERKLADLRATIDASLARGGSYTDAQVAAAVEEALDEWEAANKAA